MEDSTITREFLNYLQFEKRFSEHTAKCYEADLKQFGEFLIGTSEPGPSPDEPISLHSTKAGDAGPACVLRVTFSGRA